MRRLGYALLLVALSQAAVPGGAREPVGPSNRRCPLVISEIMYHPLDPGEGLNLEFIELYNAGLQPVSLSGWRLSGEISFNFVAGTILEPGNFLVIAGAPAALTNRYAIRNVVGPYTNALPNDRGTIRLRNPAGAVVWETEYDDAPPWALTADGAGHSLVLACPSFGERDPRAWAASAVRGGSPGGPEPSSAPSPFEDLIINEIGTTTNRFGDPPFVEFFNRGGTALVLNQSTPLFLTDDPQTNKVRLGTSGLTSIGARTSVALPWSSLGLPLKPGGGSLYLVDSGRDRVLDMVRYTDQSPSVAWGRHPDGSTRWRTVTPTPYFMPRPAVDPSQRPPFRSDVIINEIMYHPVSGLADDEFVELFNRNPLQAMDVAGWKFVAGIDFTLPPNAVIPPNGYLVVARNAARLRTNYAGLSNVVGDFGGQLSDRGERLALARPEIGSAADHPQAGSNVVDVIMDEVTYGTGGGWGRWSDGGGASLELASPEGEHDLAGHWRDSAEPENTPWTSIRESGPLEFGETRSVADTVEVLLMGEGECLVDNVEVLLGGSNRVSNGTLDANAAGWVFNGTHDQSRWRPTGGVGNSGCLHVRATAHGDTYANRVYVPLTATLAVGQQVTLGAQVRHLRGNLDVLLRIRGNWLDAGGTMKVAPGAYGTPGRANAGATQPAAPVIYEVRHDPVVPNANQAVTVSARFDGAGTNSFVRELLYRLDPGTSYQTLALRDDGTDGDLIAGDGLFSATIPGQAAARLVAFRLRARVASPPATNSFPNAEPLYSGDAFGRECLVRFGDPRPAGSFANYRIWMTQATHNRWSTRGTEHHSPLNTTFVYADQRAIYTVDSAYAGAEFIYDTPTGIICSYNLGFPTDDPVLGAREMLLDWGQSDDTGQRENVAFWIAEQMGLPFLYRRHVTLLVNGLLPTQRPLTGYHPLSAKVYWDAQEPNGDFVAQWFPEDDNDGQLYKLHHLVFGSDPANVYGSHLFRFIHFIDRAGQRHQSAYRWHWRRRGADQGASDLGEAFRLLDALNTPDSGYRANVEALVDVDQWMRMFAFERVIGNVDSLGWDNGHNMYGYFSPRRGWHLLPYDCELSLATPTGTWYDTSPTKDLFSYTYEDIEFKGDHTLGRMKQNPAFQRAYWRAFRDAIEGPLVTANFLPLMQRYQAALVTNGVPVASPAAMQDYLQTRREYIRSRLATVNAPFTVANPPRTVALNTNLVTITGTAPIDVASIAVNGLPQAVTWTSVTAWTLTLALPPGPQSVIVQALDAMGRPIAGQAVTLTLQLNVPPAAPDSEVVINEIMYHAAIPGAEFLELHNRSTATAVDVSGWKVNGLDFTFPNGAAIPAGGFAIIAADRLVFGQTYGFGIPVAGTFAGSFDQGGETLTLRRPVGTNELTVDTVTFEDDFPWPTLADGGGPSLQLVDPALDNNRVAHWSAVSTVPKFTPGAPNQVPGIHSVLPLVWLNELQILHETGPIDGRGQREPWVELYHAGASLDLTDYFLSNDRSDLTRWPFPAGSRLGSGEFKLVWLDGDLLDQTADEWHSNFRIGASDTILVLARQTERAVEVVDYITSAGLKTDQAVARVPDGTSERPRVLDYASPGVSNSKASPLPAIYINELLAANTQWPDPADGNTDDFFELYNATDQPVNLVGYSLTDRPGVPRKFVVPEGVRILPRSFLLVWADEEEDQTRTNGDLHVNFKLNEAGEAVALFAPDGRLVDRYDFGAQTKDTSLARWPDGAGTFVATTNASPGMRNKPNEFVLLPLLLQAEWLPGLGVRISFPAGHTASVLCASRLDRDSVWSQVNGLRGYDASTDREWLLDRAEGAQQRFYKATSRR